ncbi:35913_t:CDS:2 [Gigaspora margarita]|uniref:35913_t:CDS:1 n=1 Tax=Gigaspora margarita TaxID=4874 RepID=A0ABN7UJJ9_GIGMA|nr:35913_t:CDS:2 [Gigaspora margarita]
MASSSKVETNNSKSGAIDESVLEEMKSLLHEFEGVETKLAEFFSWTESEAKDLSIVC